MPYTTNQSLFEADSVEYKAIQSKIRIESTLKQGKEFEYELCRQLYEAYSSYGSKFDGMSVQQFAINALGMDSRKVYHFISIGEMISLCPHKIDKETFEKVGWTKLRVISQHVVNAINNGDNCLADTLLGLVCIGTDTVSTLTDKVKTIILESEKKDILTVRFEGDDAKLIRVALAHKRATHRTSNCSDDFNQATLKLIVEDWINIFSIFRYGKEDDGMLSAQLEHIRDEKNPLFLKANPLDIRCTNEYASDNDIYDDYFSGKM